VNFQKEKLDGGPEVIDHGAKNALMNIVEYIEKII
jgi:hypothetical protein